MQNIDEVPENEWVRLGGGKLGSGDFAYAVTDFYLTNPIARSSQLMAELSAQAKALSQKDIAAE